jgi:hypothetical protein
MVFSAFMECLIAAHEFDFLLILVHGYIESDDIQSTQIFYEQPTRSSVETNMQYSQ